MRDIGKNIYRHSPRAVITGTDGTEYQARGVIARLKGQADSLAAGEPHDSGRLESPLITFTGWAQTARPGDTLEQAGETYTVLKAEDMAVGGARVARRLTLERQVTEDDSQ